MMSRPSATTGKNCLNIIPKGTMSILDEARNLVHNDRQEAYGHPLDNFTHVAETASAYFKRKLREPLSAEDCIMFMEIVKMCRESYEPKRDNRTDGAGYWEVMDMVVEERKARGR